MDVSVGAVSDTGLVRHHNEDNYFTGRQIWAVADGMGGQAGGGIASGIVINQISLIDDAGPLQPIDLVNLIAVMNAAVIDHARRNPSVIGLGSTLSGIASIELDNVRHWGVFNVGDSRVYRFVDGRLTQETIDHNEAAELIAAGQLDPADAADHPSRSILTRAIGMVPAPRADIFLLPHREDETFLICSDGLTSEVPDHVIAEVLRDFPDPSQAACKLVALTLTHGAHDNVTAVVVAVHDSSIGSVDVAPDETTIRRPELEETI